MLRTPDDRRERLEAIYEEAYQAARRSYRTIVFNEVPQDLDADEREMWWAGTCGGNDDRRGL